MATTETLIKNAQRGDGAAREELYRRSAPRVLFRVRVRMGPKLRVKEQSGDLAQEALRRSLAGLEGFVYRSEGAFFAFLAEKVEQVIRDRIEFWEAEKRNPNKEVSIHDPRSPGSRYTA